MRCSALATALLLACSASSGRDSPPARHEPTPPTSAEPAPTPPPPAPPAPTADADAGTRQNAPQATPLRCVAAAPLATAARLQRMGGEVDVAVHGRKTGLVWQDGPIANLLVLDDAGHPAREAAALNEAGSYAGDIRIFSIGSAFAVTYVHKYGRSLQGCDLVARTVSLDGAAGDPVVLASDVCAQSGYPVTAAAEGAVVAALTTGYEGQGLKIVRWALQGPAEQTASPGVGMLTTPHRLEASADGLSVVWANDGEEALFFGLRLDHGAHPVGEPERLRVGRFGPPWILGGRLYSLRLHGGAAELRALDAARNAPWTAIDAGGRVRDARIVTTGGRSFVAVEIQGGASRAVPLSPEAAPAGPAFDLPSRLFVIDGAHGAAAALRSSPREIAWAPLSCGAVTP